jgi:RNA polymerase sigma factor (sigma-70 family)
MENFDDIARETSRIAPLIEKALHRKYYSLPPEEISIAVSEGLISYCEAAKNGTLEHNDNPAGYLWKAGMRAIEKYLKHHKRERPIVDDDFDIGANDEAEEEYERRQFNDEVLSHIENESYREILELHFRKELSFEEIAELQGRTLKAVYHSFERALHRIQEIARELGITDTPPAKIMPKDIKSNLNGESIFLLWTISCTET